ncbi:unnamed protein product [Brachionus calyciflorus]|uniref:Uncharacterized protein n=1 Tax=Brachionus calyciflorus TaxID=104777 RepID=A0A814MBP5_9BILA|nr:unnamed protein product [Brachionus calyciflorus]
MNSNLVNDFSSDSPIRLRNRNVPRYLPCNKKSNEINRHRVLVEPILNNEESNNYTDLVNNLIDYSSSDSDGNEDVEVYEVVNSVEVDAVEDIDNDGVSGNEVIQKVYNVNDLVDSSDGEGENTVQSSDVTISDSD